MNVVHSLHNDRKRTVAVILLMSEILQLGNVCYEASELWPMAKQLQRTWLENT